MNKTLLSIVMIALTGYSFAQGIWKPATKNNDAGIIENKATLNNPQLFELNTHGLKKALAVAPNRSSAQKSAAIIDFPNGEGQMEKFRMMETSNMDPVLAAKYPEIKSYVGQGIDNPSSTIYISISPLGLQTMTIHADKSAVIIEPYTTDLSTYVAFKRSDRQNAADRLECSIMGHANDELAEAVDGSLLRPNADDGKLRNFRLAVSVTGEYTQYFGGTKALALAAINNTMTRVNGIFERDFGVHMNLIANNDDIIYLSSTTDPYSSAFVGSFGAWNQELQTNLTNVIGNDNYDIGHLFGGAGGGGNAGCIGCVCKNPTALAPLGKGSGFTSPSNGNPSGDFFDVDYVAHEMGHQFGAYHTFTYKNEGTFTQVEPGSGSTIMGYAGIAGALNNLQAHSDPFFHGISIQQVTNYVKYTTCNTTVTTGNAVPVVNAGLDYTIPKGTPFMLTGSATDANNDALTYNWEQTDMGTVLTSIPLVGNLTGPSFRSMTPTTSPVRYFPKLSTIQSGATTGFWEAIPTVARTMRFRLTVRDNRVSGPSNNSDDNVITVSAAAGPFVVSSPNTAVSYAGGSSQTVTWSVAGTTGNGINAATVDILLSTDGGNTFPVTLLADTPNDGSQAVTIPNTPGALNRIMVKGSDHIFFDISNVNFTITGGASDTTAPSAPANLTASGTTQTSTALTWSTATDNVGVVSYSVYQNGIYKAAITGTSYDVTGLTAATTYAFTVKAKDAAGNLSAASNTLNVTTLSAADTTAPNAPSTLIASGTTQTTTDLSWTASIDNTAVTRYDIYQNGTLKASVTGTSYDVTGLTASTTYTFSVKAKDAAGNVSAASNTVSVTTLTPPDTTAPSVPLNLTASGTTQTTTNLAWTASTDNIGVATYSVYQNGTYKASVTGTSYAVTGLTASTEYVFTVKAKDTAQNLSDASNAVNVTTLAPPDTTAPTVPLNLTASETDQTSTKLAWSASTDNVAVTYYNIYKNGVYFVSVTTGAAYTVSGLTAQTTYQFSVRSRDAAGNLSGLSNVVNVTTSALPDTTAPTAPVNLAASNITRTSVKLTWTASTDNVAVATYSVYRNGTYIGAATSPATTYNVTGLTASTTYQFTVKGKDAAQNLSAASNAVSVTTLAPPDTTAPTAPLNLSASGTTQTTTNLSWTAATDNVGVTAYNIYRNNVFLTSTSAGTTYAVTGLTAATSYQFTVKAVDAAGNISAASNAVSIVTLAIPDTTPPTKPLNLTASNITSVSVKLSWSASTDNRGVATYSVYRNGTYIGAATAPATNFTVNGLSPRTQYQFTVKAKDAAGNLSEASNIVTITTLPRIVAAPTNLVARETTNNSTKLSWDASIDEDVTYYNVYRDGEYLVSVTTGTSYDVSELEAATTYAFTVRARSIDDEVSEDSNIVTVLTDTALSVEDPEATKLDFKIYPNPVTGDVLNVSIDDREATYTIVNLLGQQISQGTVGNGTISVTIAAAGVYILEVTSEGKSITKKFIKK